ncbi:hypothetical protein BEL07_18590 [Mycolicibacterium grossiae]|uniref:Uncharacterized protein n=3 Tax=Mycobacteriaceae TaxID=1762 RepID=A0A1E8Q2X5_9MYCO|nr:hypothetical protein TL10_26455 [Mycolicibacterium llatzerense]OFJ52264.1 hypothetical protein BEL07_18590 [Mycolicibacterium grossiae]
MPAMPTVVITRIADAAMMHSVMSRALICDMPFWARMSAGACSLQRHDPLTEFRLHGIVV